MENYLKKTTYDKILEVVAIAALLVGFYPLLYYSSIDSNAVLPTHYNIIGEIDGWGNRSALWTMALIGLTFYIGLSVLQKYPQIYNYPCKVTEQNAHYLYRLGVQLIRQMKVLLVLIFSYANNSIYRVAIGKTIGPDGFVVSVFLLLMLSLLTIYIVKMMQYKSKV